MNNALLAIGALLIAALAALFAVPYAVDWNGYRGVFEEEASRMLGRDVRVGGKVDVRLLPVPYVSFGKLRIADAVNETGEPLFRADSFTMWLSVPPLLRGVLEARAVELKKPVLRLVVDPAHGGNWTQTAAVGAGAGSLPFLPQAVALQSVRVSGGTVTVVRADGSALAELTAIDGELEAEALEGPFRFKGNARWNDSPREIRLATARMDTDGSLRFKTTVRVNETTNSYVLEGRVSDVKSRPNLEGELTAKIALPELAAGQPETQPAKGGANAERPLVDVRAMVQADGTGFKMKDIALSLDNLGQPQLVSGEAQMAWVVRPAASVRLGSKLLDLDRIAGAKDNAGKPVPAKQEAGALGLMRALTVSLVDALPSTAELSAFLAIDQATLGGQDLSNVSLLIERAGGKLELKDLKAGVPGGGRLDAFGQFAGEPGHAFAGQVALRGANLQRFLDWAAKGAGAGRADGPFLLQGKLDLAEPSLALTDATAEIGGTTLSGDLRFISGPRKTLSLTLDGRRIDAGQLWALTERGKETDPFRNILPRGILTGANAVAIAAAPAAAGGQAPAAAAPKPAFDYADLDVAVRVRAGELVAGDLKLMDADADLRIERETLVLTALKGTTSEGLGLEIEGDVASFAKEPRGTLRWVASAPTEAAASALQALAGLDAPAAGNRFAAALAPARIAGATRLGANAGKATDVKFDGQTRGGRLAGHLTMGGDRAAWRKSPLDLVASIDTADTAGLLRQLLPGSVALDAQSEPRRAGRVDVKSSGTPETGLQTLAVVAADGLGAEFDGRVTAPAAGPLTSTGALRLDVRDVRLAVAALGLRAGAGAADTPLKGEGELTVAGDTATFVARRMRLGETQIDGSVSVTRPSGARAKLTADVGLDTGTLAALAAVVSDRAAANPALAEARSGWPDAQLDLGLLDDVDGTVKARFGRLAIQPGLSLRNVTLDAKLEPRKLTVSHLDGEGLQGRAKASFALERQPAGVSLNGKLEMSGIKLEALNGVEETRRARGEAAFVADVTSTGLTPASLVSAMKGKGELRLADAEIAGFAPAPLAAVSDAVLAGKVEREGEGLSRALREAFAQGTLKIGGQKLPFEVADGAVQLVPLTVTADGGRTTLRATIDLAQLKVDGEWRVEPRAGPAGAAAAASADSAPKALPAAAMIYVGALGNLAAIEPKLSSSELERELNVRRLEREVEELERLRKADEERARAEQERQRQLEAEKQKALQESQAAQPGQQVQQGQQVQSLEAQPPAAATVSPPAPAPAWSGSTSVLPGEAVRPQAGPSAQGGGDGAATGATAPGKTEAGTDAAKDANAKPAGDRASAKPAPRPAKPRQDSYNNLYKQW